jgi:hypothetical protein
MKIDTEHLHFWMQAIRQSENHIRTMDAFWSGQLQSKEWLIENIKPFIDKEVTIDIHGGWVGVLASLIFQSGMACKKIRSIDIDPTCQSIATMMNKGEEMLGMFEAITADMCVVKTDADVIINTSCEHLTQNDYDAWVDKIPKRSLLILQSNNYIISEHIRPAHTLDEFKLQSGNLEVLWSGELDLPLYKRWMIIGIKNVHV